MLWQNRKGALRLKCSSEISELRRVRILLSILRRQIIPVDPQAYRSPLLQRMKIACFLLLLSLVRISAAADRTNVILIVADDLGYGELGCFGGTDTPTPHIDSIATNGVRFTNAYVTAPFCAASRAA